MSGAVRLPTRAWDAGEEEGKARVRVSYDARERANLVVGTHVVVVGPKGRAAGVVWRSFGTKGEGDFVLLDAPTRSAVGAEDGMPVDVVPVTLPKATRVALTLLDNRETHMPSNASKAASTNLHGRVLMKGDRIHVPGFTASAPGSDAKAPMLWRVDAVEPTDAFECALGDAGMQVAFNLPPALHRILGIDRMDGVLALVAGEPGKSAYRVPLTSEQVEAFRKAGVVVYDAGEE